ncbi:MAG: ShlB/FhaC/HecB family hemolysin secretion/activation protein [Rhodospirillales bacterium]|nr:ShlB/FhaC/HecB family hemolysin secretion/activation protein [Rhodospirillales bacterium]
MSLRRAALIPLPLLAAVLLFPHDGVAQQRSQTQTQFEQLNNQFKPEAQPQSVLEKAPVPPPPISAPPPKAALVRFTPKMFEIVVIDPSSPDKGSSSSMYSKEQLESIAWAYTKKVFDKDAKISVADLYEIANEITKHYRNDGFFLSQAYVPPQEIGDGVARVNIVEGYIDSVTIVNEDNSADSQIRRTRTPGVLLHGRVGTREEMLVSLAKKIRANQPLHIEDLERYMSLAKDLPGLASIRSLLSPSKKPGAADLKIMVKLPIKDRGEAILNRLDASVGFDNRGTKTVGPYQATTSVGASSIFRPFDKTNITYVQTTDWNELHYVAVSHETPIASEGTKLLVSGNRSRSIPGDSLAYLDMNSTSTGLELGISNPLIRRRQTNLSVEAKLGYKNSQSLSLGELLSEDRIRALRVGATYDFADRWQGISMITAQVHKGLNILNATQTGSANLTRSAGHSDFLKATLDASRDQRLPAGFNLTLAVSTQYSQHSLLASEEFGFGGSQFGRAYDSSEITGDHGLAGKLEIQYLDVPTLDLVKWHPYVFYDAGSVWHRVPVNQSEQQTASSAGGGVRFSLFENGKGSFTFLKSLSGSLEIAQPLTRPVSAEGADGKSPRFFFKTTMTF